MNDLPFSPLPMPNKSRSGMEVVPHGGKVVVVGANGTGKSRLGAWIENERVLINSPMKALDGGTPRAYRIGAQRQLSLNREAERLSESVALSQLLKGGGIGNNGRSRVAGLDSVTGVMQDFPLLVSTLFAKRSECSNKYMALAKGCLPGTIPVPEPDVIDRVSAIWKRIFPQRALEIGDHTVDVRSKENDSPYQANSMSDGERVGFYLIAQAILAPDRAAIIIDEPELHLHESIQAQIWDALESERPDCTFVYITHDLGFAASRMGAAKIVLYGYEAPQQSDQVGAGYWDWEPIPAMADIPEDIFLRILGSRRPTLFVEGVAGGIDHRLYSILFPKFYVVPSGGRVNVDRSVRAFNDQRLLHNMAPQGIIDGDDHLHNKIENFSKKRIHVLPLGCVENIMALPECIGAYAKKVCPINSLQKTKEAKSRVLAPMRRVQEQAVARRAVAIVIQRIQKIKPSSNSREALISAVEDSVGSLDVGAIFDEEKSKVDNALHEDDSSYMEILKIFRNKSVLTEIASRFAVREEEYVNEIFDLLKSDDILRERVRSHIFASFIEQE